MLLRIMLFTAALLLPAGALAQGVLHSPIESAEDLLDACSISLEIETAETARGSARAHRARCRNYLSGFLQASVVSQQPTGMTSPYSPQGEVMFCYRLPDELSFTEMETLIVDYADANPDSLNMYAADYLVEVFAATYPCA